MPQREVSEVVADLHSLLVSQQTKNWNYMNRLSMLSAKHPLKILIV